MATLEELTTTTQKGIRRKRFQPRDDSYYGPTRGVVVAVYGTDDDTVQGNLSPRQVVCDVLIGRGGIVRAPVLQHGSSVTNVSRWVPTAARTNMVTGEAIKLTQDGLNPAPSNLEDLDGEFVLIDWVERDINRPVIIGSLEHPKGLRAAVTRQGTRPVVPGEGNSPRRDTETIERFVGHQGTTARIDHGGNVSVDLRRAGVANDGQAYDADGETAGNLDLAVRTGGEVVLRREDGVPILRVRARSGGVVLLDLGSSPTERVVLAGPLIDHLTEWQEVVSEMGARVSALWQSFSIAYAAAVATGAPAPVTVSPTDSQFADLWDWETIAAGLETATEVAGSLKAADMRISPRDLEE